MKKYTVYEMNKKEISNKNLSPEDYEKAIRKMVKELNI